MGGNFRSIRLDTIDRLRESKVEGPQEGPVDVSNMPCLVEDGTQKVVWRGSVRISVYEAVEDLSTAARAWRKPRIRARDAVGKSDLI